jgi:hypothetical protein
VLLKPPHPTGKPQTVLFGPGEIRLGLIKKVVPPPAFVLLERAGFASLIELPVGISRIMTRHGGKDRFVIGVKPAVALPLKAR